MKKLLLSIALMAIGAAVYAQPANNFGQEQLGTYDRVTKHGPYLTNRFFDNWFIGAGYGFNLYMGEDDSKGDLGDRLAPALDVYVGKWITPTVGLRARYSGLKAKGFSNGVPTIFSGATANSKDLFTEKFNVSYLGADFMWSLSNAVGGYRSDRFWNLTPFLGAGWARASEGSNHNNQIAASVGLLNNFRLGGVVDITLEGRYMAVKSTFDGVGGDNYDNMASLTAGLQVKLGPKDGFKRPVYNAPADYTPYTTRINGLENDLAAERQRAERLARELADARNAPANRVVEKVFTPVTISSYFAIGRAKVSDIDMANLKAVSEIIKSNPERKFSVTGYADRGTGSVALNQRLSQERADAVANIMVNQFGVNRSQLNVKGEGGVSNNPRNPALDRVVVIE